MRHTKLKPLQTTTIIDKFKNVIPNGKLSGQTWDAKHLDNFLRDNTPNYKQDYLEKKQILIDIKNQTLLSAATNKSKESCIFRSKPRFSDNLADYSPNNFPQFFSDLNTFAINEKNNCFTTKIASLPTIEDAYTRQAHIKEFNEERLEPVKFPIPNITSSRERRKELYDFQINQREYSKWKKELANLTKKKRIVQNGFRSGALNIDNPLNDQSFYYNEISKKLKEKNDLLMMKEESHRKYIDEHNRTNENIAVDNRHAGNRVKTENIIFDEKTNKHVDDFWKVKRKNSSFSKRIKCSKDRVFGSENLNYLLDRAVFLRDAETRTKKYNIVSNNYYEPEINPDNFKKMRNRSTADFYFKN